MALAARIEATRADEVAFTFSPSRGHRHFLDTLGGFQGTLLTDGYSAYEAFLRKRDDIDSAHCWSHSRREFLKAEKHEPEAVTDVLDHIGAIYLVEAEIRKQGLTGDASAGG